MDMLKAKIKRKDHRFVLIQKCDEKNEIFCRIQRKQIFPYCGLFDDTCKLNFSNYNDRVYKRE